LLVTHNELAAQRCDRILTIRDGVIIGEEHLRHGEHGTD
jgi:predicted ABC-type transport system involved in lysophospholipase L1 biosynthesis ATPase subunit